MCKTVLYQVLNMQRIYTDMNKEWKYTMDIWHSSTMEKMSSRFFVLK